MPVAERMTADEYLRLGLPGPGEPRTQLIAGEVVVTEARPPHQDVCTDLLVALVNWTKVAPGRGVALMPLDVRLDDANVYAPDILWYAEGRAPARASNAPSAPLPDVAVEVRSPSTWRYDIGVKKSVYEARGLPELWLVDTKTEVVLVFRRSTPNAARFDVALERNRDDELTSPLLPEFSLALGQLFGG